jgi:SHS2 domain-containing protein
MKSGFVELRHTADVAIRVWAPDFAGLLAEAAHGMFVLMGAEIEKEAPFDYHFHVEGFDRESLMVAFLSELLYIYEKENRVLDRFVFEIKGERLDVQGAGGKVKTVRKEIKAATFHNLEIVAGKEGLQAVLVFDV